MYKLQYSQAEVLVNENLPFIYFVAITLDGKVSDHTTLTALRGWLLKNGKVTVNEELQVQIVKAALIRGGKFGSI